MIYIELYSNIYICTCNYIPPLLHFFYHHFSHFRWLNVLFYCFLILIRHLIRSCPFRVPGEVSA